MRILVREEGKYGTIYKNNAYAPREESTTKELVFHHKFHARVERYGILLSMLVYVLLECGLMAKFVSR